MGKILHCRDAGFDCDAVVLGETQEEILDQVRPHAADAHGVQVGPAMESRLRELIKDRN